MDQLDALETPLHRLQRHASYLRDLADFNMDAARLAHEQLQTLAETYNDPNDRDDEPTEPTGAGALAAVLGPARGTTRTAPPIAALPRPPTAAPDLGKLITSLDRATRAVIATVRAENTLFAPPPGSASARAPASAPPQAPATDTRRAPLREALHKAIHDPDPARRRKTRAAADTAVEETLLADPDQQTPIYTHLKRITARLNIPLDVAKLSDAVLGMPPRVFVRDG